LEAHKSQPSCRNRAQKHALLRRRLADVTSRLRKRTDPFGAELAAETRLPDAPERHPRVLRRRFYTLVDAAGLDEDRARATVVVRVIREATRELSKPAGLTKYVALAKAVQD